MQMIPTLFSNKNLTVLQRIENDRQFPLVVVANLTLRQTCVVLACCLLIPLLSAALGLVDTHEPQTLHFIEPPPKLFLINFDLACVPDPQLLSSYELTPMFPTGVYHQGARGAVPPFLC